MRRFEYVTRRVHDLPEQRSTHSWTDYPQDLHKKVHPAEKHLSGAPKKRFHTPAILVALHLLRFQFFWQALKLVRQATLLKHFNHYMFNNEQKEGVTSGRSSLQVLRIPRAPPQNARQ